MRRPVLLVTLLVSASVLAGCTVPSGVNPDAYGREEPRTTPPTRVLGDAEVFVDAMRDLARDRNAIEDEWAYPAFLENASAWGRHGYAEWDAAWTLDVSRPEAHVAFGTLDDLNATGRGAFLELETRAPVRALHAVRHGVFDPEENATDVATRLTERAFAEVADVNASVHAFRGNVSVPARDAFLRAEAVLGLAFTQLATAERASVQGAQARSVAVSVLDVRHSAASARWWLDVAAAENEAAPDAPRVAWSADLANATRGMLADAEDAAVRAEDAPPAAHALVSELRLGMDLVRGLLDAGLPEGAWAAAQGLQENVLVITLLTEGSVPSVPDVEVAWTDAVANVRSFRDAQRFDVALDIVAPSRSDERFGGSRDLVDVLRAFAALSLMAAISETRDTVLAPADVTPADDA